MLDRNRRIKLKPEKFQHSHEQFDLIITCEERVYDQVIDCNDVPSYANSLELSLILYEQFLIFFLSFLCYRFQLKITTQ